MKRPFFWIKVYVSFIFNIKCLQNTSHRKEQRTSIYLAWLENPLSIKWWIKWWIKQNKNAFKEGFKSLTDFRRKKKQTKNISKQFKLTTYRRLSFSPLISESKKSFLFPVKKINLKEECKTKDMKEVRGTWNILFISYVRRQICVTLVIKYNKSTYKTR